MIKRSKKNLINFFKSSKGPILLQLRNSNEEKEQNFIPN